MTRVRASPMLARWLASCRDSMNFWPAARPPFDPEAEHRARALRQVLPGPLVVRVRGQAGVVHVGHALVGLEPFGDGLGVLQVLVHALRQRLHALQQLERRLRRTARADVAQLLAAQLGQEAVLAEVPPPGDVAVGGHRLGHGGNLPLPQLKRPALDDDAAQGGAVPAEELGGGVDHDVRAVLDRAHEVRRAQGGVDDQRDAGVVRHLRQPLEVRDLDGRVGHHLDEDRLGVLPDRRGVVGRVGAGRRRWCRRRSGAASRRAG